MDLYSYTNSIKDNTVHVVSEALVNKNTIPV